MSYHLLFHFMIYPKYSPICINILVSSILTLYVYFFSRETLIYKAWLVIPKCENLLSTNAYATQNSTSDLLFS